MIQAGRVAVSLLVLSLWGAITLGRTPPQSEANMKLMDTLATAVVFYWVGSSSGSDRKTEMLGDRRG